MTEKPEEFKAEEMSIAPRVPLSLPANIKAVEMLQQLRPDNETIEVPRDQYLALLKFKAAVEERWAGLLETEMHSLALTMAGVDNWEGCDNANEIFQGMKKDYEDDDSGPEQNPEV